MEFMEFEFNMTFVVFLFLKGTLSHVAHVVQIEEEEIIECF